MSTLKIGIIGLGDIAVKAYLPVMSRKKVEIHLYTRRDDTLVELALQYRFPHRHESLDSLIASGIVAAFVHVATAAHEAVVRQLLEHNIHVYVDKPVTYDYTSTERLVALAESKRLILMAGFNRRFAPAYTKLKMLDQVNMVIMQKNRRSLPGDVRTFVFDDFIHVIDTLLFLLPGESTNTTITGRISDGQLCHVLIQRQLPMGVTAIGIMNRDSGTVEESVEVFTPEEKWVVRDVFETTVYRDGHATRQKTGDWDSTLHKRGFEQITDSFLQAVSSGQSSAALARDILRTHQLCEQVVSELSHFPYNHNG